MSKKVTTVKKVSNETIDQSADVASKIAVANIAKEAAEKKRTLIAVEKSEGPAVVVPEKKTKAPKVEKYPLPEDYTSYKQYMQGFLMNADEKVCKKLYASVTRVSKSSDFSRLYDDYHFTEVDLIKKWRGIKSFGYTLENAPLAFLQPIKELEEKLQDIKAEILVTTNRKAFRNMEEIKDSIFNV